MQLPPDAIIAPEKISGYLLRSREEHDKAGFLALAGYTLNHASQLEHDIRTQLLPLHAAPAGEHAYGAKFEIRGSLTGPNGRALRIISISMVEKATGLTKFITLFPAA